MLSIRRYEARDQPRLEEICRGVYGGTDYLPRVAPALSADESCTFLVGHDGPRLVAAANLRRLSSRLGWLEAVRTEGGARNRGHGERISRAALRVADEAGLETLSATTESNAAMRRVFDKLGMRCTARIRLVSWDTLRELPGWAASAPHGSAVGTPAPLLCALGLDAAIGAEERAMAGRFEAVRSVAALRAALRSMGGGLADDGVLPVGARSNPSPACLARCPGLRVRRRRLTPAAAPCPAAPRRSTR